jgi:hypothetical protein
LSFKETSLKVQQAVLKQLQSNNSKAPKMIRFDRNHHGLSLTEEDAGALLKKVEDDKAAKQQAQSEKKTALAAAREAKRLAKIAKTQQPKKRGRKKKNVEAAAQVDVEAVAQVDVEAVAQVDNVPAPGSGLTKGCFKCKTAFDNNPLWRACESEICRNWSCPNCLPKRLQRQQPFFCTIKCRNSYE